MKALMFTTWRLARYVPRPTRRAKLAALLPAVCVVLGLTFAPAAQAGQDPAPPPSTATASSAPSTPPASSTPRASSKSAATPGVVRPLAGQFDWTANLKYPLYSRTWYQNAGNTYIVSNLNCTGAGISTYKIYLLLNTADGYLTISPQSGATYQCNQTLGYTWHAPNAGYYTFLIEKANNGTYISGTGYTTYP